tara:strand:- start:53509 stop:53805 length:297 start_codon:yes stop_codon:yes gene_type:complete
MNEKLYEELKEQIEQADWSMLKDHHKRGAMYLIDGELDLIEVAVAIAEDNITFIKDLLGNNKLRKPSDEEVDQWNKEKNVKLGSFLIVQPYVLVKQSH